MCGIVSIFNIQEQTPELRQQALRMSQKIRHRGPDWSGIYCGGSCCNNNDLEGMARSGRTDLPKPSTRLPPALFHPYHNQYKEE